MGNKLAGKVAVVTGAGRGIGRGIALMMSRESARVVVNDLGGSVEGTGTSQEPAQQVVDQIRAAGGEALADFGNVADWGDAQNMIGSAIEQWGKLDNPGQCGWNCARAYGVQYDGGRVG